MSSSQMSNTGMEENNRGAISKPVQREKRVY